MNKNHKQITISEYIKTKKKNKLFDWCDLSSYYTDSKTVNFTKIPSPIYDAFLKVFPIKPLKNITELHNFFAQLQKIVATEYFGLQNTSQLQKIIVDYFNFAIKHLIDHGYYPENVSEMYAELQAGDTNDLSIIFKCKDPIKVNTKCQI